MNTSRITGLSNPIAGEKVPLGTLAYFRSRAKRRAYDLVIKEFKKSGITQVELARRLGKGTDRICKVLGGPGNWTLDTVSDLLFAISGAVPVFDVGYPLNKPVRNRSVPEWLVEPDQNSQERSFRQPPPSVPPGPPTSLDPLRMRERERDPLPKELTGAR
jgi:hypothetical protein